MEISKWCHTNAGRTKFFNELQKKNQEPMSDSEFGYLIGMME